MDPTTITIIDQAGPWYQALAKDIGPLAATLLLFLGVFGFLAWKITLAVIDAWRGERQEHRQDIDRLVTRIDERDKFQREELASIARSYERTAQAQITALEKVEAVLGPLNHQMANRPCMLHEQKVAILQAVKEEAVATMRNARKQT